MTTAAGASNPLNFYYIGAPFKASLSAASGPSAGGNTVTISGTGLATASSVAFGGNNATPTVTSDSLLSVTVPAGASGSVGVSVTTTGGANNGFSYTYVDPPTITSLAPTSGSTSGGTTVTITGTDLSTTESVTFDGVTAPFGVINSTTVSAVTPPAARVRSTSSSAQPAEAPPQPPVTPTWRAPGSDRRSLPGTRRTSRRPGHPEGARAATVPPTAVSVHRCEEAP